MKAAYYERNGSAREVLQVGEVETPRPGPGEVRVKLATSGVNPSDVKSRQGTVRKIAWPRVIPQSDGAGVIDAVGADVPQGRIGEGEMESMVKPALTSAPSSRAQAPRWSESDPERSATTAALTGSSDRRLP